MKQTVDVTLENDFHGTECKVRVKVSPHGIGYISKAQVRKVENTLCGVADCQCGGVRDFYHDFQVLEDGSAEIMRKDGCYIWESE